MFLNMKHNIGLAIAFVVAIIALILSPVSSEKMSRSELLPKLLNIYENTTLHDLPPKVKNILIGSCNELTEEDLEEILIPPVTIDELEEIAYICFNETVDLPQKIWNAIDNLPKTTGITLREIKEILGIPQTLKLSLQTLIEQCFDILNPKKELITLFNNECNYQFESS